ncbi:MAG: hypothetical protein AB8B61_01330 [Cyclobacteriaceae bacterium]
MSEHQKGIVHIHLLDKIKYNFDTSFSSVLKNKPVEVAYYEIDNFSDAISLLYAEQFIESVIELKVFITADSERASVAKLNALFHRIGKKEHLEIIDDSKNSMVAATFQKKSNYRKGSEVVF